MTKEKMNVINTNLIGIYNISPKEDTDPHFCKSPCPLCNSVLAGNRHDIIGRIAKTIIDPSTLKEYGDSEIIELCCCEDCYLYLFA